VHARNAGLSIDPAMAKTAHKARIRARIAATARWQGDKMMADQDMKAANETYTGFLALTKWGMIFTALVTVLVVILIA
jgi:hypothetical protein